MSASGPLQESGSNTAETRRLLSTALVVGLVAAALALLAFAWLGREIVTGVTPAVDELLRSTIHDHSSPGLTRIMIAASVYGGPSWLGAFWLVFALAFFFSGG